MTTWKLVPTDATDEMIAAMKDCGVGGELYRVNDYREAWRKALEAAPIRPPSNDLVEIVRRALDEWILALRITGLPAENVQSLAITLAATIRPEEPE
jgi:hypothetical protein